MRCLLSSLSFCLLCLTPLFSAVAEAPLRLAVVAGNNEGTSEDGGKLRFAQADARDMSAILTNLGDFNTAQSVTLLGRPASAFEEAVAAAGDRFATSPGSPGSVFLLYFSGHAAADGLHFGDTVLTGARLKKMVQSVPAAVKIVIVDACHSGALVFLKGATPVEPFLVGPGALGDSRGTVYLVSSGVSEKSQEAPELGHSVFTYWLLSGLRGAADGNGDGWVSLPELWEYARSGTALTSTRTGVAQRPMWQVNLKGRTNVHLASLHKGGKRSFLRFPAFGHYWLFSASGALVTEVHARLPGRQVTLAPGAYLVRRVQNGDHLLEAQVELQAGKTTLLPLFSMRKVPYIRLASKGGNRANWFRQGPQALIHYHGETLQGLGAMLGGGLSWTMIVANVWLVPRLLFGASSYQGPLGRIQLTETELDLSADYGVDLDRFILRPGLVVGAVLGRQEITRPTGSGFDRTSLGFQGGVRLGVTFVPFRGRAHLDLGLEAVGHLYRYEDNQGDQQWRIAPMLKVIAGLGYVL